MGAAKVAITLDEQVLRTVDRWVKEGRYPNRSQAIQAAIREKMERWKRTRLAEELAKLDIKAERALAEESSPLRVSAQSSTLSASVISGRSSPARGSFWARRSPAFRTAATSASSILPRRSPSMRTSRIAA